MAFQMNNVQKVDVSVEFKNAAGLPVDVSAIRNVVWSWSTELDNVAELVASPEDPAKAVLTSLGNAGFGEVSVAAEYVVLNNGAEEVYPVTASAEFEVTDSGIVFANIVFGTPVNK